MASPSGKPPRRRRLGTGLVVLLLLAAGVFAYGEYRAWQLRDSCTGNAGRWDRERQQCTFHGGEVPAPPLSPPP
ncbi:hypothetical protein H5368_03110 [Luteimonas sp. MC1782]|uniref:hypothetical protein n=1 Tax=Luteimonas sp. MC1782 TaxID=2760305 RepID=UPI001601510F|nr:hypothetical protein [Luteimonas sp. MC1782]MBB1472014.1 hypothetical protein [Luteimonas sp. MC1782]